MIRRGDRRGQGEERGKEGERESRVYVTVLGRSGKIDRGATNRGTQVEVEDSGKGGENIGQEA